MDGKGLGHIFQSECGFPLADRDCREQWQNHIIDPPIVIDSEKRLGQLGPRPVVASDLKCHGTIEVEFDDPTIYEKFLKNQQSIADEIKAVFDRHGVPLPQDDDA